MTTKAAARLYMAQHLMEWEGKGYTVYNPHSKPLEKLPVIYAFSNVRGGGDGVCYAMAEDGTVLGSHYCSNEGYAPHDLGVRDGARTDRHTENYQKHYADGYRMDFVPASDIESHEGLKKAFALNQEQAKADDTPPEAPSAAPGSHREGPEKP